MKPRVKICGITNAADARLCADAGADALGFIFYEPSPRSIDPASAAAIIRKLPPFITPVGVFVNETRETIASIVSMAGIRIIQLSGDEPPGECRGYPVAVVKAFRIENPDGIALLKEYDISAALLDGRRDGLYGGTGTMADLAIAAQVKKYHPLILAGGLNPGNVQHAVRTVGPYAIDVNTGVEASPGKKDPEKIKQLFERLSLID